MKYLKYYLFYSTFFYGPLKKMDGTKTLQYSVCIDGKSFKKNLSIIKEKKLQSFFNFLIFKEKTIDVMIISNDGNFVYTFVIYKFKASPEKFFETSNYKFVACFVKDMFISVLSEKCSELVLEIDIINNKLYTIASTEDKFGQMFDVLYLISFNYTDDVNETVYRPFNGCDAILPGENLYLKYYDGNGFERLPPSRNTSKNVADEISSLIMFNRKMETIHQPYFASSIRGEKVLHPTWGDVEYVRISKESFLTLQKFFKAYGPGDYRYNTELLNQSKTYRISASRLKNNFVEDEKEDALKIFNTNETTGRIDMNLSNIYNNVKDYKNLLIFLANTLSVVDGIKPTSLVELFSFKIGETYNVFIVTAEADQYGISVFDRDTFSV